MKKLARVTDLQLTSPSRSRRSADKMHVGFDTWQTASKIFFLRQRRLFGWYISRLISAYYLSPRYYSIYRPDTVELISRTL
jgi:hypothetical protein